MNQQEKELYEKFSASFAKDTQARNAIYSIKKYLVYRSITLQELIDKGISESEEIKKFVEDESVKVSRKTRSTHASYVRKFLRWTGAKIVKYEREKQELKFKDDPVMKKFLLRSGSTEKTKKNTNYQLNKYCEFKQMSPSELIEEAKELDPIDIELLLKEFYDSLELKTKESFIFCVARFYKTFIRIYEQIVPQIVIKKAITKKRKGRFKEMMLEESNGVLTKETIIKLLESCKSIRDRLVIVGLWESGLNPVDLVKINYGQMKQYINLKSPDESAECAVIFVTRQKNEVMHLATFGKNTLYYMGRWLSIILKDFKKWDMELTDNTPLFTEMKAPYKQLARTAPYHICKQASVRSGFEYNYKPSDYRNSYNTRAKNYGKVPPYIIEVFMGHTLGIEGHYTTTNLDFYKEKYLELWEVLYNLEYPNERVDELEDELIKISRDLTQTKKGMIKFFTMLEEYADNPVAIRKGLIIARKDLEGGMEEEEEEK